MIASIPSLGQDYKEFTCGWRAFDRLCSTKYGRIKRRDAGYVSQQAWGAGLE